jgi:glycosyltransferase involved in cell wall biosynthesis
MIVSNRISVLVVGQTPPPVHGQAVMIERLLRGKYASVRLYHVRMAFSDSIGDVGRFRVGKIFHLLSVIAQIVYHRIVHRIQVLYYPPAGPNQVPIYRDLAILLCTRWMFCRTVFHLHASGISEMYPRLSRAVQFLFRCALCHPDAVIRIVRGHSSDAQLLHARREYVVPNGIEDEFGRFEPILRASIAQHPDPNESPPTLGEAFQAGVCRQHTGATGFAAAPCEMFSPLRILFVGALRESKGVMILIEACRQLAARRVPFELLLMGEFHRPEFALLVRRKLDELGLAKQTRFLGILQGTCKYEAFAQADVLCLPTHYESETFPTVLLEAMSFALPVVATRWRGIPEIVDHGRSGFLVDIHAPAAIAERLEQLQSNPVLRRRMGQSGREKFLREFTAVRHLERMERVFVDVATGEVLPNQPLDAASIEGDIAC